MDLLRRDVVLLLLLAMPASAQEVRVLPLGEAECVELSARLARNARAWRDPARGLAAEGRRLCRDGYFRAGVAKLRRAVRATQGGADTARP
ncbi:hypothetical protein [Teichococcus oryzae]|uniref:UrcA family protein n=1 Tax=Teichococcus oryzae TaxID=1608942 RepID=A0A5B2TK46_9PROT|nr:hypothetical protein [Pseudoroseomonas oryzae]KAA2214831.1 hypothetical protein F0Q34_03870 [Pseudoroseomonas oryzae]